MTPREAQALVAGKLRLASRRLAEVYPFHGALLANSDYVAAPGIGTMAVTLRELQIAYLYEPEFVLACSLDELGGTLHHEANHVVLGHLQLDPADFEDANALTIAQETTVNEYVTEPLPGNPVLLRDYPHLPPYEDTLTRYERLRSSGRNTSLTGGGCSVSTTDNHEPWHEVRDKGPLGQLLIAVHIDRAHGQLSCDQQEALPPLLQEHIREAQVGTGTIGQKEVVLADRGKRLDWRTLLRQYVREATRREPSLTWPARRFPELIGLIPGWRRVHATPVVMACIDTSGSISSQELAAFAGELSQMCRGGDHRVIVVECDVVIHSRFEYRGGPLREFTGRGGTDLRPPFERKFLASVRPDVVVYMTDGDGPAPSSSPVPTIWCLTPEGHRPAPWGRVVTITGG